MYSEKNLFSNMSGNLQSQAVRFYAIEQFSVKCWENIPGLIWCCFTSLLLVRKTRATLSTNRIQKWTKSRLGQSRFPALQTTLHWFLVIFSIPLIGTEWRSRSRTVLQQIISKHQSMCFCNLTVVSSAILNCYAVVLLPDSRFPVLRPSFPVPNFKNISSVAT